MQVYKRLKYSLLSIVLLSTSAIYAQVDSSYFTNLHYRSLGPSRGGRSTAVVGDLKNRDLFYMGTTGGGVWKTANGGSSWQNISDGFFGGSIGSIAIAPSDDNVIYVGQGEESLRGNVSSGNGVWKSMDAGITWKYKGLPNSRHITRLAINPDNHDVVFAAVLGNLYKPTTERGLYVTYDGGESWSKKVFQSDSAGFNEVIYDPLNSRNLYATSWQVQRTPYSFSSGGKGSGLWKSKDGGKTWVTLNDKKGLPKGILGKITVSASSVQKNLVYAMVEHASKGGLYRSKDAGETWEYVNGQGKIRQRAWYFSRVYCDTKNPETVYVMNVHFQKSTDGGKTFEAINTPHVDHHDLWVDPQVANRMITANDGGGQVSYNGGQNWSTYLNQPTEQFYRVTTDNHVPYRIYGAQQDNSTMRVNHVTGQWEPTAGGESAHMAIDPNNNDIVYAGSYGGYLTMYNHKTSDSRAINVWPDNPMGYGAEGMKYRFQWNFPVFFSPHSKNKLYAASNHLHVSYDGGGSWEIISPDLTRNDPTKLKPSGGPITKDNTGVEYYCTIFSAIESPIEKDVLWVGSDDGLVHISRDGGKNWSNITPKGLPEWTIINSIEAHPNEKGVAYVVATGYKTGDNRPLIFKVSEYGKKAELLTNGIPNDYFVRVVRCDLVNPNLLYAGTEQGMFISHNGGKFWQKFQLNLPIVPITDIAMKDNDLIVATQGRGFYILDNLNVIRVARKEPVQNPFNIISSEDGYLYNSGHASVCFFSKDSISEKDTFYLDIVDENQKVVRTYSHRNTNEDTLEFKPTIGFNYKHWYLNHPGAKRPKGMILWWATTAGPKAKPGKYYFRIYLNGEIDSVPFQVHIDPNSLATRQDYIDKYDFLQDVISVLDKTHDVLEEIVVIQNKLNTFTSEQQFDKDDELKQLSDSIVNQLDEIRNTLYQTKNRSNQDPINFPIKLNNKLAHLNSLVRMGNYGPTKQAVLVKDELIRQINAELTKFDQIKENEISTFNKMLRDKEVDLIKLK